MISGHEQAVSAAVFSPDGKRLLTASLDNTARIWDAHTGAPILVLAGHAGPLQSAGYSPDGRRIVTASSDKTARIWDAYSGLQLAVLRGHQDSVQSAVYSPDGLRIITASLDKTARIWDARISATLDAQILWQASAATSIPCRRRSATSWGCRRMRASASGLRLRPPAIRPPPFLRSGSIVTRHRVEGFLGRHRSLRVLRRNQRPRRRSTRRL